MSEATHQHKNLNKVVTRTATKWKKRAKIDRSNRRNITISQAFVLKNQNK